MRTDTDEGLAGWGEAKAGVGSAAWAPTRSSTSWSTRTSVADGQVEIPDRPGLGITVDADFVHRHARG